MGIRHHHFSFKKSLLKTTVMAVISACAMPVLAGTVVLKPGAQDTFAPEFGRALARSGNYTVVAAMQETIVKPGEPIFTGGSVAAQGAVYLFNGTNANAERIYQFPGNDYFYLSAGSKVAISGQFMAFAASNINAINNDPSYLYVVRKTNGQWPQCPTVGGVIDCTSLVSDNGAYPANGITRIPFNGKQEHIFMNIAISDNYLVMTDSKRSQLSIYKYDATNQAWAREFYLDDIDERQLGAAIALDGDKVAVSAPSNGIDQGSVRIYSRDASSATWSATGNAYGYFTEGNFGRALDMQGGNLVVSAGQYDGPQHLAFYSVAANGSLSAPTFQTLASRAERVVINGNTAVVNTQDAEKSLQLFKRDTNSSGNVWNLDQSLNGWIYASQNSNNYPYPGADEFELVDDDLVLGWRGYAGLVGGFIHEKVSLIDSCKNPQNLVGNCSFDNSSGAGWQFLTHQGAAASVSYSGSQLKASIYNAGSDMWHIQARRAINLPATQNYQLTFRAKADNFRKMIVNIGHDGSQDNNWQSYGRVIVSPGPEWVSYTYDFASLPADAKAVLDFNLGDASTYGVMIDSVSLLPQTN